MARAGGTAGGGMGGGPDSAPGGSSASGPGTDGPGNAPGEGMGAGAFGGGGGVESAREKSAQAFREAIARAMGVTAATPSPMSPEKSAAADIAAQLNAREEAAAAQAAAQAAQESRDPAYRDAAVEAQVMGSSVGSPSVNLDNAVDPANLGFNQGTDDADAIAAVMDSKGAFATQDDDPVGISMAGMRGMEGAITSPSMAGMRGMQGVVTSPSMAGMQGMQGALTGATTLDDPQGTEKGLTQAEIAQRSFDLSTPAGFREQERVKMGMPSLTDRTLSPEEGAEVDRLLKAYREAQTPFGRTIRSILDTYTNYSTFGLAAKGIKAALDALGFNVNPGIVEQAIRNVQEINTQGARGAGGVSVGSRNDGIVASMLESGQLDYVEPWMKGLSDQQIQYYFDRPSELEWVRTTWSKAFGLPSKYNN